MRSRLEVVELVASFILGAAFLLVTFFCLYRAVVLGGVWWYALAVVGAVVTTAFLEHSEELAS